MNAASTQYDAAAYAIDAAIQAAVWGDVSEATALVSEAVDAVSGCPYPHLSRDFRVYGAAAIDSLRAREFERADTYMRLLLHVIEDMERFEGAQFTPA
jgi:hypothetical protein